MGFKGKSGKNSSWGKWSDAWGTGGDAWGSSAEWSGKGKWPSKSQGGEATEPFTGRIWSRYQFNKMILRASAGPGGTAFQSADQSSSTNKNVADDVFLGRKNLKKLLSPDTSHLLRRPGVGVSEIAGSVQAGLDVLQNFDDAGFLDLRAMFDAGGEELAQAWKTINTEGKEQRKAAEVEEAFKVVFGFLSDSAEPIQESLVKATVAAARTYLMGASLLQLQAAVTDLDWWAESVPSAASECPELEKWQKKPQDVQRLAKAMGALVEEKARERAEGHDNSAASIFSKKRKEPSTGAGDDADEAEAAAKKAALEKAKSKKDKTKKKKDTTSDSSTSESKKAKKKAKKEAKKKAKKEAEAKEKLAEKVAEKKANAFTTWSHGAVQTTVAAAESLVVKIGKEAGGVFPTRELDDLIKDVPEEVLSIYSGITDTKDKWAGEDKVPNTEARSFVKTVLGMGEEVDHFWSSGSAACAGGSKGA